MFENKKIRKRRLEEDTKRLKNKWKDVFEKEDPYFNINFRHDIPAMRIRTDRVEK